MLPPYRHRTMPLMEYAIRLLSAGVAVWLSATGALAPWLILAILIWRLRRACSHGPTGHQAQP